MSLFSLIAAKWRQVTGKPAKPFIPAETHEEMVTRRQRELKKKADEWKKRQAQVPPPSD